MTDEMTPYCHHFHRAVEAVTRRWSPEIIRAMLAGTTRFSDLSSRIPGLSDRVLSERLKDLEAEGIVVRTVHPDTPVRIEYTLSEKGADLASAVIAIAAWADRWISQEEAEASTR